MWAYNKLTNLLKELKASEAISETDYKKLKGCVRYSFASLFCVSKREHIGNKETTFYFTSKAIFVEIIKF